MRHTRLVAAAVAALLSASTLAQAFPTQQVLIVVPFAPGGSNDIIARVMGERLQQHWGQSVVIENQAGAAGSIGVGRVAKAEPTGHTLVVISMTFTINAVVQAKQAFDPIKSFAPVALIGRSPMVLALSKKHAAKSPQEFLALANANPGKLSYGSAGAGSINHIGAELIASATGIKVAHVPYRGVPLALNDVVGGHIDFIVASLPPMIEQVQAGKVTGLAVTARARSPSLPDLPTLHETIAKDYELYQWWAVLAPSGTPLAVVERLNRSINVVLELAEVKSVMAREGAEVTPGSPEVLARQIASDIERWQRLVNAGILQAGDKK